MKLIGQRAFDENVAAETRQQVFDDLRKALERDPCEQSCNCSIKK